MKPSTEVLLKENLKLLKLSNVLRQLETFVRQAKESGTDYGEFLLSLTEMELQMRAENRLKRRVREAKFPLIKTLETFDYTAAPGLDLRLLRELETGDYIREHRNIILLGNSGTGKTHLATGLGVAACGQGFTSRFVTGCGLANELIRPKWRKTSVVQLGGPHATTCWLLMSLAVFRFQRKDLSCCFRSWPSAMRGGP